MAYGVVLVIAVAAATLLGLSGAGCGSGSALSSGGRRISLREVFRLSEKQIDALLARLEAVDPPDPIPGAMCYFMSSPVSTSEYVCPSCGEKTVYTDLYTELVEWRLADCRRLYAEIQDRTEMNLLLDERGFCQFCSPSGQADPALYLTLRRADGSSSCTRVEYDDLSMLNSFLRGSLTFETWTDGIEPIRPHADRIREMLGYPAPAALPDET